MKKAFENFLTGLFGIGMIVIIIWLIWLAIHYSKYTAPVFWVVVILTAITQFGKFINNQRP